MGGGREECLEDLEPRRPLELIVCEQHRIVQLSQGLFERLLVKNLHVGRCRNRLLDGSFHQFTVIRAIINKQKSHSCPHSAARNSIQKTLPCPMPEVIPMRPPISSTALRTVASPRPTPL